MKRQEFIRELLAAAQESGITAAEVYFQESESMRIMVSKGNIEEYGVFTAGGLSLRGLVDGKMGMAYSEAMDKDAMVMLIRGVLESATLISDMDEQFIFEGSPSYPQVDTTGNLGSPQERIDLALLLESKGRSLDPNVQELGYTFVETERETVQIVNTNGVNLSHQADMNVAYIDAVARRGDRVTTFDAMNTSLFLANLDAEAIAREAVENAVMLLDAMPCKSGKMPVIFRNDAMSSLLGVFSGIFSAEAAQKGLSLLAGKEGEQIAAPGVTIIDDPLMYGGLATRAFDAEGVATYTKNVIENGTLKTLLHNLKTAKKAGCKSTGNAARAGYAGSVGIAPRNLYIKPGELSLAALEAQMGDGIVITSVTGLHAGADDVSGDFSLLSQGYLVENGKRTQAVEQITVAGNFFTLLKDITAIGSDLRAPVSSILSPSILVGSLSIAGK